MILPAAACAPLLLLAVCTSHSTAERSASAVQESLTSSLTRVRMAEICAERRVNLDGGLGASELVAERNRLQGILDRADRIGLEHLMDEAERDWRHFQAVADWVCGEPSGPKQYADAIDALAVAVDMAARARL